MNDFADMTQEEQDRWADKTADLPGVDLDAPSPTLLYQLQGPRAEYVRSFPDGSTTRGSITREELLARIDVEGELQDGWYDVLGEYFGDLPPNAIGT